MRTATRMVVLNSKKYVLDLISAVIAVAYSLRRLYSSYTGAAIRVRRSSDNAQIDIGFIGEHLDVLALLVFVGNGSGFVTTWYDQSGNGRHATQVTAANQPQIVSNGVIETQNGSPALLFDGVNDRLDTANIFAAPTGFSIASVVTLTGGLNSNGRAAISIGSNNTNGVFHMLARNNITNNLRVMTTSNGDTEGVVVTSAPTPFTVNTPIVTVTQSSNTEQLLSYNGNTQVSVAARTLNFSASPLWIGGYYTSGYAWQGSVQEITAFPSVLSTTDRQTLERNQGIYFNISVS